MRTLAVPSLCVLLVLAGCGDQPHKNDDVVDTTLNDADFTAGKEGELTKDVDTSLNLPSDVARQPTSKRANTSRETGDMEETFEEESSEQHIEEATGAAPRGSISGLFSSDDYPASAISSGAEGVARAKLTIGTDGRVLACDLVQSTGNTALDSATCSILRRRARFTPARDSNGHPIIGALTTPPITWRLER